MALRITYDNKLGLRPKKVQINQVWDDDMNELKNVINSHADDIENITNIPFGTLLVFQSEQNAIDDNPIGSQGDTYMGQLNNEKFLYRGEYNTGDPLEDTSYINPKLFDPNS